MMAAVRIMGWSDEPNLTETCGREGGFFAFITGWAIDGRNHVI